jgi:hypothetical protein
MSFLFTHGVQYLLQNLSKFFGMVFGKLMDGERILRSKDG